MPQPKRRTERARARRPRELLRDAHGAAEVASLEYVSSDEPGIRRRRRGKHFDYTLPNGSKLRDPEVMGRIRALAIPPAWEDVWICPDPRGHLQATGRDARGRKQYRYHPRWRSVRDQAKYHDVVEFARHLPKLRKQIDRDLGAPRLTKDKVIATLVRVMERTCIRVGNDRYAEENGSYGLTTLLDRHAQIRGGALEFEFRGKGGKPYRAAIRDARLATIVKRCRDLPGQRLFQYVDADGQYRPITSTDVNDYLRRHMGQPFTAKTFRTWAATLSAAVLLAGSAPGASQGATRRTLLSVVERVAEQLGNTPSICRKSYVHPAVVEAYAGGELSRLFAACRKRAGHRVRHGLRMEECAVLALLEKLHALAA